MRKRSQKYVLGVWGEMSEKGKRTFPCDLARGAFEGAGHSFLSVFALSLAIGHFQGSDNLKSLIASGSFVGLTLSFLYATYSHHWIGRRNVETAAPVFLGGLSVLACGFANTAEMFTLFAFLAGVFFTCKFPLLTAIYRENYRRAVRGQLVGFSLLAFAMSSAGLSYLGGWFLRSDIERFRVLCFFLGGLVMVAGFAVLRIPSEKKKLEKVPSPFSYFSILRKDPMFVYVLWIWFLFGFGNLVLLPQRFEFVMREEYGFDLGIDKVAFLVGVIPEATRMLLVIPMGWLFDRMNFILLRLLINLFFLAYILVFFNATSVWMLALGSILLGTGFAGGSVAWNLWVTKYAKPGETTKYMAMHAFFNGVRGILAPFAGYWLVARSSVPSVAWMGAGLVVVSSLLLLPLLRQGAPNDRKRDLEESLPDV